MKNKIDNFIDRNVLGIAVGATLSTMMLISGLSYTLIATIGNL